MKTSTVITENIDEILATPADELRDDQIKFLENILEFNRKRKKSFW